MVTALLPMSGVPADLLLLKSGDFSGSALMALQNFVAVTASVGVPAGGAEFVSYIFPSFFFAI